MKNEIEFPQTLAEAIKYFADASNGLNLIAAVRWPDGKVVCPSCRKANATFMESRKVWNCRECYKQFSVKVGTIFEESSLGFDKWLPAFWMIVNSKNGISSCELARALGVTQKTAWFMLHRIRLAIQNGSVDIDHAKEYVRGNVHTNGLENFWSLLKRAIRGTYVTTNIAKNKFSLIFMGSCAGFLLSPFCMPFPDDQFLILGRQQFSS
jgi:transposase-like protein